MKRILSGLAVWSGIVFLAVFILHAQAAVPTCARWSVCSPDGGSGAPDRMEGVAPLTIRLVTSTLDSGPGTLRQALLVAQPGDVITFDPAAFPFGVTRTISIWSAPLPTIAANGLTIDGSNARVVVDGSGYPVAGTVGLRIEASGCRISGLTVQGFGGDGISIAVGTSGNIIGGDRALGRGNVIILNGYSGIAIRGYGNTVRGNYIGIDRSGTRAAGNHFNGVALLDGASDNTIGGSYESFRNVISGNGQNGVWIWYAGTDRNIVAGNYIGTNADGEGAVPNGQSGVSVGITSGDGPHDTRIGGAGEGEGNLISGNTDMGIWIGGPGTDGTQVLGNLIGVNKSGTRALGWQNDGVIIRDGASNTRIGSSAAPNVISGSKVDGICIEGVDTMGTVVQGNLIGTNIDGSAALPNGHIGVELTAGTHDNLVGGNRWSNEGNVLSGNANHGLVITGDGQHGAHHNTVQGNLVGPDKTGSYSLGHQPFGGIDITHGAHDNIIGGLGAGQENVVSGNHMDGIAVYQPEHGNPVTNTQILGNFVGLAKDGSSPLPNAGDFGILVTPGVSSTRIEGNRIAYHQKYGIQVSDCNATTITANSIYSNTMAGIYNEGHCLPSPEITGVSMGAAETITGKTLPGAWVEVFSDDGGQGRAFEGDTQANALGDFTLARVGGFAGPNVTATARDGSGNTSDFSPPTHLLWTVLMYLSGDNDLGPFMIDTLTNTAAAGPSPQANVLILMDGYTTTQAYSGTAVYDITRGEIEEIGIPWAAGSECAGSECNMGDPRTLQNFVEWGQANYPARHTLLSIVDHGGGWAAGVGEVITGTMPIRRRFWLNGGSGLSWDFSDGYDYLTSVEIRQAMAGITDDGAEPLDIVFFDACLMGMAEVAYQIQDYALFFVGSQNLAWAPLGLDGRYVRIAQSTALPRTAREMAEMVVSTYADTTPPEEHPFTVSAVDLAVMPQVAAAADQLAVAINQTLPGLTTTLHTAFSETQKLDYDADLCVEPATDGFVDLYDFALKTSLRFSTPGVVAAAQELMATLGSAIVAEAHRSGMPWAGSGCPWDLENTHGLSVFLPLGEDLEFPFGITPTLSIAAAPVATDNLHLRDLYTCDRLSFVCDTAWKDLIDAYYEWASVPITLTHEFTRTLLTPDVTPPRTTITVSGAIFGGRQITVRWASSDLDTGMQGAELWYRHLGGDWTVVGALQPGSSGAFSFVLPYTCANRIAVRGIDRGGNRETFSSGRNAASLENPAGCAYLPFIRRTFW